ncbi:MAG: hypothetical protein ABJD07_12560 [Gemmatimonadaceae bacterium]
MSFAAAALVAALAACASQGVVTSTSTGTTAMPAEAPNTPGAPTARNAVERFLGAVKAQDFQSMAMVWGTEKGPARDQMERATLEKREYVMQCYLAHESFAIDASQPMQSGQIFDVTLTNRKIVRQTKITAVQGPASRWFIMEADLRPLTDLCKQSQQPKP